MALNWLPYGSITVNPVVSRVCTVTCMGKGSPSPRSMSPIHWSPFLSLAAGVLVYRSCRGSLMACFLTSFLW